VRFVEPAENERSRFDDCAFKIPMYSHYLRRLHWYTVGGGIFSLKRMIPLVLNEPQTTAYSLCCDHRPYTIRAHLPGEHDPYFYDAGSVAARNAVWLYMPIDKDEKITQIWIRWWLGQFVGDSALIVGIQSNTPGDLDIKCI
jgi:hypothetical protein